MLRRLFIYEQQLLIFLCPIEKCGGSVLLAVMNGRLQYIVEAMAVVVPNVQEEKGHGYNPIATRHYPTGDFATFSATKFLINEIMSGKTGSKLPFEIIFWA